MSQPKISKVLDLIRKIGVARPRDLKTSGIPREYLIRLYRQGLLQRPARGIYVLSDAEINENHSLAETCKRAPHGIVCLLSALRFHGLTTQAPFEVWIAIDRKARMPKQGGPPMHIVRFSGEALSSGVEEHIVENVPVSVFCPAKTVADCFKYRNKIGLDVALEALRDCWRNRRCTLDDLWRYAKICRVANVMRPYLESLT
ncbi:MAG: type IV toxin-antitoxin system AbiEi family antitoxin domain-containing protein [Nitrospirota bacterium]